MPSSSASSTASTIVGHSPSQSRRKRAIDSASKLIEARIAEVCSALWWAELIRASLTIVMVLMGALMLWFIVDQWIYSPGIVGRVIFLGTLLCGVVWFFSTRMVSILLGSIRPEYAARSIERDFPELRQALTSFVTLKDSRSQSELNQKVIRSIGAQAANQLKHNDVLPKEATGTLTYWLITAVLLALLAAYALISPKSVLDTTKRLAMPLATIEPARRVSIKDVLPGNAEALANRDIEVSASIKGLRENERTLVLWQIENREESADLRFDVDTNRYLTSLEIPHTASGTIPYWIEAGDTKVGPFHLRVRNVPVVAVESTYYDPPDYTNIKPHSRSSAAIKAIDGTIVTVKAKTNRPIKRATLQFNPKPLGDTVHATAGAKAMVIGEDGRSLELTFPIRRVRERSAAVQLENYQIKVWDDADQSNPEPIIYPIEVIPDLAPEITIVMPRKSPKDIPIDAQQIVEIHAADVDFGLRQVELEIRRGIDLVARAELWRNPAGAKGNQIAEYRFRPFEHLLHVGDKVQVVAIATDNRSANRDDEQNHRRIHPNITRTDPIELRISTSDDVPQEPQQGEGLSKPDQQPAASPEKSDSADEGESQGGGSGDGDGQQQSGKGGEGSNGGSGGETGEQKQSESNDSESNGDSSSGSDSKGDSDKESGGSGAASQSNGGKSQGGNDTSKGSQSDEPMDDQSSSQNQSQRNAKPSEGEDNDKQPNGRQDNGQPASESDQTGSKSEQQGEPDGKSGGNAGDDQAGSKGKKDGSPSNGGASGDQKLEEPSGESGGQKPQHDGEAFERIRDYLNEKRQQETNQGDQVSGEDGAKQDRNSDQGDGGQSDPQYGDQQDGDPQKMNDNSQGPKSENNQGGDESRSSGQEGGEDSSKGDSSSGDDNASQDGAADDSSPQSDKKDQSGQQSDAMSDSKKPDSSGGQQGGKQQEDSTKQDNGMNQQEGQQSSDSSKADNAGSSPSDDSKKASKSEKSDTPSGEQDGMSSDQAQDDSSNGSRTDPKESKQGDQNSESNSDSSSGEPTPNRPPSSDQSNPSESESDSSESASQGITGNGSGTDGGESQPTSELVPDPVDPEHAKNATDMVLDYLDETRDKPDKDLLEQLDWSEEDMRRFQERWKSIRDIGEQDLSNQQNSQDLNETLESLGIRPPSQSTNRRGGTSDRMRGLRDSGNRKPPPAAHRDAFESFRRAIGR